MDRMDTAGIVGGGVVAAPPQDWERRIAERSERLYRARVVRRLLILWVLPGNALLAALSAVALALWSYPLIAAVACALLIASIATSGKLLYGQHFKVRSVESELRALEFAQREQLLEELESGDPLVAHKRYRAQLPEIIDRYRVEARHDRWKDNLLQSVVIGGSIIAATTTAMSVAVADVRWFSAVLCLVVALSAAFAGYAQYRERSAVLRQTADGLEREYESVELRAGRYRRFDSERDAYAEFADAVEALRAERAARLRSTVLDTTGL